MFQITEENDYLLNHFHNEQKNWYSLKSAHLAEVQRLQEQLDETRVEKTLLEGKFAALRSEHDRVKTQIQLISEDARRFVPVEEHQDFIRRYETMYKQLKETYENELSGFHDSLQKAQTQLRQLTLEVAKIEAEMAESKRINERLKREAQQLKKENDMLSSRLSASLEAKENAEKIVSELIAIADRR